LVISKQKGITLAFRSDPLEAVEVSSSFDSIPSTKRFLQNQIEEQIRKLFLEVLPKLVHSISLNQKAKDETQSNANSDDEENQDSTTPTPITSRRSSFSEESNESGENLPSKPPRPEKIIVNPNTMTSQMARLVAMNSTLFPYDLPPPAHATHRTNPQTGKKWRKVNKRFLFGNNNPSSNSSTLERNESSSSEN